tara:strand:- start:560 stop:793 length:234 start_codon:yes stop_codon:yes gene_type:complete
MDKNVQLLVWGTGLTLGAAGLMWMVSTLVSVDKRTEVINVKMDHLVQAIDGLTERQASIDKSWTDTLSSLSASRKSD